MGWEVEKKEDLKMYADRNLKNNNIEVTHGQSSFADKRFVKDLIYFKDPQGNQNRINIMIQ